MRLFPEVNNGVIELRLKGSQQASSLKPPKRIHSFDEAQFAFEMRFEQELTTHWNKLEAN
jgi:hypothetical protein